MDQLIAEKIATYKRHVTLKLGDGIDRSYISGEWLGRPPFNVGLRTLHAACRLCAEISVKFGGTIDESRL